MEAAVAEVGLCEALPGVRKLATGKAIVFARRCRLAIDEREDVESQLVLTFLTRWPKYDAGKASIQTFACRLMDKQLISIMRYRLAQRRQVCELPVVPAGPTWESIQQFRIDIDRALAKLPDVVRNTASALSWCSNVDAAILLGCSRQMVHRRKSDIRKAFVAAGIGGDYFSRGGTRS
jgi:DNA-directed RNA polymerase specialized sigma24 family protein